MSAETIALEMQINVMGINYEQELSDLRAQIEALKANAIGNAEKFKELKADFHKVCRELNLAKRALMATRGDEL